MKTIILISFVVAGVCADLSQSKINPRYIDISLSEQNPIEDGEILVDDNEISADLPDKYIEEYSDEFSRVMDEALQYLKGVVKLLEDDIPKVYNAAKNTVREVMKLYHNFAKEVGWESDYKNADSFLGGLFRNRLAAERKQISKEYYDALRDIVEKFSGLSKEEIDKWSSEDLEKYVVRLFDIRL